MSKLLSHSRCTCVHSIPYTVVYFRGRADQNLGGAVIFHLNVEHGYHASAPPPRSDAFVSLSSLALIIAILYLLGVTWEPEYAA